MYVREATARKYNNVSAQPPARPPALRASWDDGSGAQQRARPGRKAPQFKAIGASARAKKQAPGFGHRGLKASLPDIHIRHAQGVALLA